MKKSSYILYGVLTFGVLLIAYIFSLFAGKSGSITPSEWLLLTVVYVNYALFFFDVPLLFGKRQTFSARIPGIGISAVMQGLYTIFSVGFVIMGVCAKLPFEYLVTGQGIFFFLLMCGVFFAVSGSEKIANVEAEEKDESELLQSTKLSMERLSVQVRSKPFCTEIAPDISRSAETIRYLSAVSSSEAKELERSIKDSVDALYQLLYSTPDAASWGVSCADARRCAANIASLIAERKSLRN